MMVRGLVFLARMHASERRFQRHARRRRHHAAEAARHLAGMEAEVRLRTWLCQRREATAVADGVSSPSACRSVVSTDGLIVDTSSAARPGAKEAGHG
jgi:hypothetical protein